MNARARDDAKFKAWLNGREIRDPVSTKITKDQQSLIDKARESRMKDGR